MAKKKNVVSTKKNVTTAKKNVTASKKNKKNKLSMIILVAAIVLIVAGVGGYLLANKGLPGGGFNIMKPQPVDGGCKVQYCTNCKPNNPNYCIACSSGYTRTSNGQCAKSCEVKNCKECVSGNKNKCKKCDSGYISNGYGGCRKQCEMSHCNECVSGDPYKCKKCDSGYVLLSFNHGCWKCNVDNCKECGAEHTDVCKTCNSGYTVSSNGKCVKCAVGACKKCVDGSSSECETCDSGYIKTSDGKKCVKSSGKQTCYCINGSPSSKDNCVTSRGQMTYQECTKGCKGGTPVWGASSRPSCPYTFYDGTCRCTNYTYSGTCYYKWSSIISCSNSCSTECKEAGGKGKYICPSAGKTVTNTKSANCSDVFGNGYVNSYGDDYLNLDYKDVKCGIHSDCKSACNALGYKYSHGGTGKCTKQK